MSTDDVQADLGVLGGSGLYELLDDVIEITVDTPWGMPSAPMKVGRHEERTVAFLPRHGERHEYPPHRINFGRPVTHQRRPPTAVRRDPHCTPIEER